MKKYLLYLLCAIMLFSAPDGMERVTAKTTEAGKKTKSTTEAKKKGGTGASTEAKKKGKGSTEASTEAKKYMPPIDTTLPSGILNPSMPVVVPDLDSKEEGATKQTTLLQEAVDNRFISGNDGLARDADAIFMDSGLPSSFKDVEYYDVALPYMLTCEDIGGCDSGMSEGKRKLHISKSVMAEFSIDYAVKNVSTYPSLARTFTGRGGNAKIKYSYETSEATEQVSVVTDANGVKYYVTAVQPLFFTTDAWKKFTKDPDSGGESIGFGQIFDVIMTDGTTAHFIYGDTNATEHTNGATAKLKLEQYAHLFAYQNGNNIELWCNTANSTTIGTAISSVTKVLGLDKDDVYIAYYRFYNAKIGDDIKVTDNAKKGVYKMTGSGRVIASNGSVIQEASAENQLANEMANVTPITGSFSTASLDEFIRLQEAYIDNFGNIEDFKSEDLNAINNWKYNIGIDDKAENKVVKVLRSAVMLFAILLTLYSILIYIAYWFDKINNIIDFDLLNIMTFGKLRVSDTEESCTFRAKELGSKECRTVNHRAMVFISFTGLLFGALIISGVLYDVLLMLVRKVFEVLGK